MKITARKDGPIVDLLVEAFGSSSRTHVRKMLKYNMIQVSGQPITRADFAVNAGDVIEYVKKTGRKKGTAPPVPIIFEDDDLLIAEKPAGLLTFGERGTGGTSLYRLLKDFFNQSSGGGQRLHVVHRLDREVSGIVLFAKNAKVQQQIKKNWKGTKKRYHALVEGRPEKERGTIKSWLREGVGRKMASSDKPAGAKLAVTHYRVVKRLNGHTLLEIETETGRKNQVRVQVGKEAPAVKAINGVLGMPVEQRTLADFNYHAPMAATTNNRRHSSAQQPPSGRTGRKQNRRAVGGLLGFRPKRRGWPVGGRLSV